MGKKVLLLLVVLLLSCIFLWGEESDTAPRVTSLPVHPEFKEDAIKRKYYMAAHSIDSDSRWEIKRFSGYQKINVIFDNQYKDDNFYYGTSLANKYKGIIFSVDVGELFSINSNLIFSFSQDNYPINTTVEKILTKKNMWESFHYMASASKKISIINNLSIEPLGGYSFSQYFFPYRDGIFSQNKSVYHSLFLGGNLNYHPYRILYMDFGISVAPLGSVNGYHVSTFQTNVNAALTIKTNYLTIGGSVASTNKLEFVGQKSNYKLIQVLEVGFLIRIEI